MSERWLPVRGYEALYAVSSNGRVKSIRNGRIMSPGTDKDGYPIVSLYRAGKRTGIGVHRLVALNFHGEAQSILHSEVSHLDGNRKNCCADNLKWVSKVENHSHKRAHGTHPSGERHPRAKLTWPAVRLIRSRRDKPIAELAKLFGVSTAAISDVRKGRRWRESDAPNLSEGTKQ